MVLLVDSDPDTLAMYSVMFESEGVWVSTAADAEQAFSAILNLKPDLVVTEITFAASGHGGTLIDKMKAVENARDIPVVVLSGREATDEIRAKAALCLQKPVLPDALMAYVDEVLRQSHHLRARGDRARRRAATLIEHSARILRTEPGHGSSPVARACPSCQTPLGWIEHGRIDGTEYDYYRWCRRGCGLFCYDTNQSVWVKLA